MKNSIRVLGCILLSFCIRQVLSAQTVQKASERMEVPKLTAKDGRVLAHTGYVLSYNTTTNCANWVAWQLTKAEASADVAARVNDFRADEALPRRNRVEAWDYKRSGYDRGHMCPAGDMKWSADAMSDCFLMSNICPQRSQLNQKWWEHVERACRRWASKEGCVYICCGPIYGKSNKSIGNDVKVRVPDAFFKVVLSLKAGQEKAIGFIYQNTDDRQTMDDAAVTVDEVERRTGYDFFPLLDKSIQDRVEAECNLRKWK